MAKVECPNGHIYDSSIYGDECPLCPKSGMANNNISGSTGIDYPGAAAGTQVTPPFGAPMGGARQAMGTEDPSGPTEFKNGPKGNGPAAPIGGGTVIRQPKGAAAGKGRKLVGFLVSYNRTPLGKAYEIYEGKNYIGRDRSSDIAIPDDNQMSGRHMSILYRNVDNKFKYRDEQSSNGTFVNKELSDEGELQNYDIIRLGNTVFIFMAIPKLD